MTKKLTAIIEREGDGFVALCQELDVASQGDTVDEARKNLQEALELFFETASPEEIKERLHEEVYWIIYVWCKKELAKMESLKQEVLNVISKMPDTADIDDIMYRLYVIDKVRKGKEAVQRGETVSIEDLKKEMASW